jgi:hypothetical protein
LLTRAKNSQAKNYEFQKKKTSYFQSKNGISSFALTTQVIQENSWTPETLQARQNRLTQLLEKAWNLNVDNSFCDLGSPRTSHTTTYREFYINSVRGANATGVITDKGFKVIEGSYFAHSVSDSYQTTYVELRSELISSKILVFDERGLKLTKDYMFSSPSTAAGLVMGRSANGLTEWKTESGLVLKDFIV